MSDGRPSSLRPPPAKHIPAKHIDAGGASRAAALDLLQAVLDRHQPLGEALASVRLGSLPPRDRAFVRNIVATTLRRLGQIDDILDHFVHRRPDRRSAAAWHVLRLGLCQLLFLETPAHAAVHSAVALARTSGIDRQAGLINAVLRRAAAEAPALLASQDAARLNTPPWLWNSWRAAYGPVIGRAIAEAHLREPPLDLTARDAGRDARHDAGRDLADRLGGTLLPTGSVRLAHAGSPADLPGFDTGTWWVQDAAAALPARLFSSVAGRRIIDLCAAPGGKTAQLTAAGALVTAVERSPARMRRLRDNLARLRLAAEMVIADAIAWRPPVPADAVLVDAPCSATGTMRRHPDIAWLKRPEEIAPLTVLQDRLLGAAIEMVRPNGQIIYCVCSLQPEEGPGRIAALIETGAPVIRQPIAAAEIGSGELAGLAALITAEGDIRTLPCHLAEHGGLDGFYICRLRRL